MRDTTGPMGLRTFAILATLIAAGCAVDVSQQDGEGEVAVVSQALMYGSHAFTFYQKEWPLESPDTHFTYQSNGLSPTFSSAGTGRVTVHFDDLPGSYGNVQITAVGSDTARCKVQGWYVTSGDRSVDVRCHNSAGTLTNSSFVVYYHTAVSGSIGGAYLLNSNPTSALDIPYNAPSGYRYNEFGGISRITRTDTGVYENRLPGHGAGDGIAHVTAYGTDSAYCNVSSSLADGDDQLVRVRCYDTSGQPANSGYSLDFKPLGFQNIAGTGASAVAHNSASSSYRPTLWYNSGACQPKTRDARATRTATGKYQMRFDSMSPLDTGVIWTVGLVSGYGSGSGYCKIGRDTGIQWWSTENDTDIEIPVRCYNNSGGLMDRRYTTTYVTPWVAGWCPVQPYWLEP
jgi:hypothetical protein